MLKVRVWIKYSLSNNTELERRDYSIKPEGFIK